MIMNYKMNKKLFVLLLISCICISSISLTGCSTSIATRKEDTSSTLYVGHIGTSFPTSFMPWLSRDGIAPTIASMLYNTLFSYDEESGEFNSLIAKQWCYVDLEGQPLTQDGTFDGKNDYSAVEKYYNAVSEDYMVVRVELFDNIYWSDGKKLTVEDVYYSFDIGTDNALSNHAGALAWTADLKHESNRGEVITQGMFTAKHPDYSGTFGIAEHEKDTVMYLLVNKVLGAVTTLFNTILILPEHIWAPIVTEEQQLNNKNPQGEFLAQYQNPIGSGGWILNREETNTQMITLDRNPNYHLTDENGGALYKVDKIKILLYLDANTAVFALRKGYIDMLDSSISSNYLSLFEQEKDIFVSRSAGTSVTCLVLNINPTSPYNEGMKVLLQDVNFRKAIALAIHQEELVKKVLNGAGTTASAGLILKNNEQLYHAESDILVGNIDEKVKEANAILDNLYPQKDSDGYRLLNGERISFEILTVSAQQDLVAYLQRQFQKIGIDVQFKASGSTPETTYIYPSNFDMTVQTVVLNMANADVMYKAHFVTQERSSNYGKYENEHTTNIIEEMRYTLNQDKKVELIKELQKITAEEYYKIPLYASEVLSVARTDRFTGYVASAGQTIFNMDTLANLKQVQEVEVSNE
ncbi:MAG: ABC transporter substrate-binding protein [Lachnospiraceae bacterium]|nr:ABC transporter substrate-binding protein [Lachnospiraceae bacterium]